ncbi:hypothetical protein [Streptomyces synnematoformans]|uniref:Uncharacterized protein n=1 Tax=Streptomyces synnematoformans TaxID=415721 RepID=A0ABN2X9Y5_9ACTN
MIPRSIAEERATQRCEQLRRTNPGFDHGAELDFLIAFARARDDAVRGFDHERRWLGLEREGRTAAMAGFIEGLASTRLPDHRPGADR